MLFEDLSKRKADLVPFDEASIDDNSGRSSLTSGTQIGSYRIEAQLAKGGMGTVYLAFDTRLNRRVAIKFLACDVLNPITCRRFQREAQMASSLNHPHILIVHDVGEFEGRQYLVTEFVDGGTLKDWVHAENRDWRQVVELLVGVADGLAAAHAVGMMHRDIKPTNILVTKDGHAKLADFGLAKMSESIDPDDATRTVIPDSTLPGVIVGTIAYMSPEQAAGHSVDARSDIFSFGLVLYELLSGRKPFAGSTDLEVLQMVMHGAVQPLPDDIPPPLRAIVEKAMEKNPADRYQSMQVMVVDLRRLLRQGDISATTARSRGRASLWRPRTGVRAGIGAAALVSAIGAYWLWFQRPYQPARESLAWYERGVSAIHSMTFEAARRALEQAVTADPKFALAHASLAHAYDQLDYSDLAKDSMLRALTLAAEMRLSHVDRSRIRAFQCMLSRDYERAVALFTELEKEAGEAERPAAALECGWAAQQREDTQAAAAAYARALKMDPRYAAAKLRMGYLQGRRRELQAALQSFTEAEALYRAASDYEGVTETILQKASLLNRSSRAAEALPLLASALSIAQTLGATSQQIRLQLVESVTLRNLGDTKRASEIAQHAVDQAVMQKMENVATSGLIDLGNAFLVRGDPDTSEQYYRRALDFARRSRGRRNEARAQISLGSLFELRKRPDDAQPFIEAALNFYRQGGYRREFVQATTLLGSVHEERSEFTEAVRILREALPNATQLQDKQVEAQARERLAGCLRDQGDWPAALAQYEHVVELFGAGIPAANARASLAQLYWQLGRRQDAERTLSEVERLLSPETSRSDISREVNLIRSEMAYTQGHLADAAAIAARVPTLPKRGTSTGSAGTQAQAILIQALILIRTGRVAEGLDIVERLIQQFERDKLAANSAAVRLRVAEALLAAKKPESAARFARESLAFFQQQNIWESLWRACAALAQFSKDPEEAKTYGVAARSALDQLRTAWPPQDVDAYLQRPDIAAIYKIL